MKTVRILNRMDEPDISRRLSNAIVSLKSASGVVIDSRGLSDTTNREDIQVHFLPRATRYVEIYKKGECLHFREVQVYGSNDVNKTYNLALGKQATQKSNFNSIELAGRAVDGDLNTQIHTNCTNGTSCQPSNFPRFCVIFVSSSVLMSLFSFLSAYRPILESRLGQRCRGENRSDL